MIRTTLRGMELSWKRDTFCLLELAGCFEGFVGVFGEVFEDDRGGHREREVGRFIFLFFFLVW